jgi:3-dehydroquinate synthase
VREHHYGALATGFARFKIDALRLEVPEGERSKTLGVVARLYDALLEAGADRDTAVVGLGGGAVTDVAGFAASTYLRGVPLVQVPTTLLAQVDASVGGKNGVNHRRGKNLIGTFYQPRLVWIDPDVLATLPARDLRCGMAEVVKVAAIWDAAFFAWLEQHADGILALDRALLSEAIARSVQIKAEVVGLDEREAGLRSLLNFGHTLGHAIEQVAGYRRVRHGEAVAMGMVFAARLSARRSELAPEAVERIERLLSRLGLRTEPPEWDVQRGAYLRALAVDKKMRGARLRFVVLRELGRAELCELAPEEILEQPGGIAAS